MISFVKGKFNFLAAFCIVALIFITVAIMNAHYMYKKIRKMNTFILIHRTDNTLLGFMIGFTIVLGIFANQSLPDKPQGIPQPDISKAVIQTNLFDQSLYKIDRSFGIGQLSEDGWWNFDRIDIFKSLDDSFIVKK